MSSNIILAGCGGGYDVFCTIPLFYKNIKKNKIIVSLSFTDEKYLLNLTKKNEVTKLHNNLFLIDAKKIKNVTNNYFPEYYLSKHLNHVVYIILKETTINEIIKAYNIIIHNSKRINELYLVDGGCDLLLSGNESDLATPVEDMMHLSAVRYLPITNKYACAIGMPCDCIDLKKSELINRLDDLSNILVYQKIWSLKDENVNKYYQIVNKSRIDKTVVNSLICSALEGKTGYYLPEQLKYRLSKNNVEIDELMVTFVQFDLIKLSHTISYLDLLNRDDNTDKIDSYIMNFHKLVKIN